MLHTQLLQMNPGLVEEQQQLIVDLQTKVNIVEKELTMVSKQTLDEIKVMQSEKEKLQSLLENRQMDGEVSQQVSELTIHQVRGLLVKSKVELQEASNQIKTLKQELKLQQEYYEKTMLEDRTEQEV